MEPVPTRLVLRLALAEAYGFQAAGYSSGGTFGYMPILLCLFGGGFTAISHQPPDGTLSPCRLSIAGWAGVCQGVLSASISGPDSLTPCV